jgi:RNA polymerase sigma-70 factor, ECF subfamily
MKIVVVEGRPSPSNCDILSSMHTSGAPLESGDEGRLTRGRRRGSEAAAVPAGSDPRAGDDEEPGLIARLKAGDHEAFEALFQRHFATVYRQAFRLLGHQAEAEEVVQEVFLTLYEKAQTFRGASAFSTWLYRITMNAALNRLRRRKRTEALPLDDYLPRFREDGHHLVRPVVDWSNELEERLAKEELSQLIQEAMDQLQPVDKAVVMLSDVEGLSDREISTTLGLTVSAVKARLHRSRLVLRGKLAVALGYSPS